MPTNIDDLLAYFLSTLRDLMKWLKKAKVRGVIIGGLAYSILAEPRVTADVDSIIFLETEKLASFLQLGEKLGFYPRIKDLISFAQRNRVLLMEHHPTGVGVDLSLAALPFEQETLKRSSWFKFKDVKIPLPTPEDLIIMKAVAHRPQDLVDIDSLLEVRPKVDSKRIRQWVREFSDVMEMPEIFEDLEKMLRKKRK